MWRKWYYSHLQFGFADFVTNRCNTRPNISDEDFLDHVTFPAFPLVTQLLAFGIGYKFGVICWWFLTLLVTDSKKSLIVTAFAWEQFHLIISTYFWFCLSPGTAFVERNPGLHSY